MNVKMTLTFVYLIHTVGTTPYVPDVALEINYVISVLFRK